MPLSNDLAGIPFVVTDTETTGTKAEENRIIEIGAVKVLGGEVVGRFSQLVNPERAVPSRISQLTGITTAMVFDQPTAAEVMPRFLDFLGAGSPEQEAVLVAHNLPFDLRFLNAELARAGRPPLPNPALCTLRLARRLLQGLRSKGLTAVADFYGIPVQGRHRALGDAEATAEVLLRFLRRLHVTGEVETLGELLAFQHSAYSKSKQPSKPLRRIRDEVLPRLPDRPGIYFMKDAGGATLYIGKAKRLSDRVRSYFTAIEAHPPRLRKLVEAVRDVAWEETPSELAALLLESRLIKEQQPRFNRAQRRYRNRPFIRLDARHAFPSVSWSAYLMDDGAEYFGPLGGRRQAELVTAVIERFFRLRPCDEEAFACGARRCIHHQMQRCEGPCEGGEAAEAYAREVQRVRDFLTGTDRWVLGEIEAAMKAEATALRFEQAALYRDWHRKLERMMQKQACIAAPVLQHNAVIVQRERGEGAAQLFVVRFGRLAGALTLPLPPTPADVRHLRNRLAEHFDGEQERPERYFKREIDEVRVLAHWLYVHRASARQVHRQPGRDLDAFVADVCAEAAAAQTGTPVPGEEA